MGRPSGGPCHRSNSDRMKRLLSFLLIPLSIGLVLTVLEGIGHFFPLPVNEKGLENAMDLWGMSLFSCVRDEKLGYRLKPGAPYGKQHINSLGYVGKEFTTAKDPGTFRIVCVGGSTTFCTDVSSDEYTWPAQLERAFSEISCPGAKRVEVINAGVPGYHTWHTRLRLDELEELNPDLYLFMDGFNDVNASSAVKDSALDDLEQKKLLTALVGGDGDILTRVRGIARKSRAYQVASRYVLRINEEYPSQGLDSKIRTFNTEDNEKYSIKYLQHKNRKVILLNHPWIVRGTDPARSHDEELRLLPGISLARKGAIKPYIWGREYVRALNSRLSKELGVDLIDPQPTIDRAIDSKKDIYTIFNRDSVHLTDYGNSIFAQEVFNNLLVLPNVRSAIGIDEVCARDAADKSITIVRPEKVDWGSGWLNTVQTGVHVSVPAVENVANETRQHEGWGFYTPVDASTPGVIGFGVVAKPGTEHLLFFMPRIARNNGSVELFLQAGGKRTPIFKLTDFEGSEPWLPIATRYMIDLSGISYSDYILEFVLVGKYAQLWHDEFGNALFFR